MKNWHAKHEGKWYKVKDIVDTGKPVDHPEGGNMYHLDGLDKPVHQSKIEKLAVDKEDMEKHDKIKGGLADKKKSSDFDPKALAQGIKVEMEHTSDRKIAQEIAMDHLTEDPNYYDKLKEVENQQRVDVEADGKRELDYGNEELNKLKKRWNKLKKALDSSRAILNIASQEFDDTSDLEDDQEQQEQVEDAQDQDPDLPEGAEEVSPSEDTEDDEDDGMTDDKRIQEIERLLEEEGYSPAEIAHIVHGHVFPGVTVDDIKMDSESAMAQHKLDHIKRMNDLDYEKAQKEHETNDLDREHKKRMLDLEYEYAKKEKEMDLANKQAEAELKRKHLEDRVKKAFVDYARSRRTDASKTSQEERKGK